MGRDISVSIGKSRSGVEILDIGDAPHILIAGETGGGKTNLSRVIAQELSKLPNVRLGVIDITRKLSYLRAIASFAGTDETIKNLVFWLGKEMERRYDAFDRLGIDEITYSDPEEFPSLVLIIDEFNHLSPAMVKGQNSPEKYERYAILNKVTELTTRGRGCGIHLIIGLQRPDANVMVDGQIKGSLPVRFAFRTTDFSNSRIIIDSPHAGLLPKDIPGRCMLRGKDRLRQVQIYNLPHDKAKELVKGGRDISFGNDEEVSRDTRLDFLKELDLGGVKSE